MGVIYTKNDVREFLQEHFVMQLATATSASRPAGSVMVYAIDDDFHFYCMTHVDSQKARNMLENPQVSLTVWEHQKMLVQVDGVARQITQDQKKDEIMELLADSATRDPSFWPPIFRISGGAYVVFSIAPTWMRVLDLTEQTMRQNGEPFTTIIDLEQ